VNHGPVADYHECEELLKYKQKAGLRLFFLYLLIYAVFVVLNTAFPAMMESVVFLGLNLAIVYGFGLIFVALLFGLIYNLQCTRMERRLDTGGIRPEGGAE
jgi:uncharacterized membrane protein (DUF485 family)